MTRRTARAAQIGALVLAFALVPVALAARGGHSGGGGGGKPSSYSPTLSVSWPTSPSTSISANYIVSGCGYNGSYGGVNVAVHTPVAIQVAGSPVDANGCISVSNFWTQGAGHYTVDAYQTIGRKDVLVASTSFDVN